MKKNIIINLHAVNDAVWFENLVVYLKKDYNIVEIAEFEKIDTCKKRDALCGITFDDGDKSFYRVVLPIIKKHNIPVAIFVSPQSVTNKHNFWFQEIEDYDMPVMHEIIAKEFNIEIEKLAEIDLHSIFKCFDISQMNNLITKYLQKKGVSEKTFQNIDLAELIEIQNSGLVTIGAHTMNHPILSNESDKNAEYEITASIIELEKLLGQPIRYFAYPNGRHNFDFGEREKSILKNNNIALAFTTHARFVDENSDKLEMPRVGITTGSIDFIKRKIRLAPYWEKIKSFRQKPESVKRTEILNLLNKN